MVDMKTVRAQLIPLVRLRHNLGLCILYLVSIFQNAILIVGIYVSLSSAQIVGLTKEVLIRSSK